MIAAIAWSMLCLFSVIASIQWWFDFLLKDRRKNPNPYTFKTPWYYAPAGITGAALLVVIHGLTWFSLAQWMSC